MLAQTAASAKLPMPGRFRQTSRASRRNLGDDAYGAAGGGASVGDLVKLNRYRKQRDRTRRDVEARENLRKFGRSKLEKPEDRFDGERERRKLDGKKLDEPS